MQHPDSEQSIFRITALWAFSECALGGVMHALKLPFTGFLVGGFAVLCIGLLAQLSGKNAAVVLRSTLLVLLVKAVVSPQSPPTAYLAVGFQGLSGALILCYLRPFALAAFLFGFLALVESAVQKILVLWLFFGNSVFEAIDLFFKDVLKNFGLQESVSWSSLFVWGYVVLYALWGLVLGHWIVRLPGQLARERMKYTDFQFSPAEPASDLPSKKSRRWVFPLLVLAFIVATFLLTGGKSSGVQKAVFAVWRSAAVLAAWFFLFQPLVSHFFQKWAKRKAAQEQSSLAKVMETLPEMRENARQLYRHIALQHSGWKKFREFVVAMFVVAVYPKP